MKFFSAALLASSLLSATLALPAALRDVSLDQVPDGTYKVAFDESTGLIIAFDKNGEKITSYAPSKSQKVKRAGTCQPLSVDDVQKSE